MGIPRAIKRIGHLLSKPFFYNASYNTVIVNRKYVLILQPYLALG